MSYPPSISAPHPEDGCLKVGFPLSINCMINFRQQGGHCRKSGIGCRSCARQPAASLASEGIILDLGQSFHVACVIWLQQCIALLDDGALILGARAGRRSALSAGEHRSLATTALELIVLSSGSPRSKADPSENSPPHRSIQSPGCNLAPDSSRGWRWPGW